MAKILIIDDEPGIRLAFEAMLSDMGHQALSGDCAEIGLAIGKRELPDIIFLDYRLPDRDGLSILPELKNLSSKPAIICMTAYGAMEVAVNAMKSGAYEYLSKPLDLDEVASLIDSIDNRRKQSVRQSAQPISQSPEERILIGNSLVMQEIFKLIGLLTNNTVTVLITGESGVGKELVARAIHANGPRAENPFLAFNCGAIAETLIESELFGYEQGAFTGAQQRKIGRFELAQDGTFFLDEVAELCPAAQVKLLRVLQEHSYERLGGTQTLTTNARIIAATNRDLGEQVRQGAFRQDLYYRLQMITVRVPPLREHPEDIPLLANHFLSQIKREQGISRNGIEQQAMELLEQYHWPGNVRQLEHQIRRAAVLCRDTYIGPSHFDFQDSAPVAHTNNTGNTEEQLMKAVRQYIRNCSDSKKMHGRIYEDINARITETMVKESMQLCRGNQVKAAELLGISRSTLRKKLSTTMP
jgi:DNA-binding NtrC family response regulator